jgi:hypothetical protein
MKREPHVILICRKEYSNMSLPLNLAILQYLFLGWTSHEWVTASTPKLY